jgi:hypothetical protein
VRSPEANATYGRLISSTLLPGAAERLQPRFTFWFVPYSSSKSPVARLFGQSKSHARRALASLASLTQHAPLQCAFRPPERVALQRSALRCSELAIAAFLDFLLRRNASDLSAVLIQAFDTPSSLYLLSVPCGYRDGSSLACPRHLPLRGAPPVRRNEQRRTRARSNKRLVQTAPASHGCPDVRR